MRTVLTPAARSIRRALCAAAGLLHEHDRDIGCAVAMMWPYLWYLDPAAYGRLQVANPVLPDDATSEQLRRLAAAVVAYDEIELLDACATLVAMRTVETGNSPTKREERRRQRRDTPTPFDWVLDEDTSLEVSVGLLYRIGARLIVLAADMAHAADQGALVHDLVLHLEKSSTEFGWWMEGMDSVLRVAAARAVDPVARDIMAEMHGALALVHLGFDHDPPSAADQVSLLIEPHLEILSAGTRWLEDPTAALHWTIDPSVREQWEADLAAVRSAPLEVSEASGPELDAIDDWVRGAIAEHTTEAGLLDAIQERRARHRASLASAPPELAGAHLRALYVLDQLENRIRTSGMPEPEAQPGLNREV